jgi:hypothetical protein
MRTSYLKNTNYIFHIRINIYYHHSQNKNNRTYNVIKTARSFVSYYVGLHLFNEAKLVLTLSNGNLK